MYVGRCRSCSKSPRAEGTVIASLLRSLSITFLPFCLWVSTVMLYIMVVCVCTRTCTFLSGCMSDSDSSLVPAAHHRNTGIASSRRKYLLRYYARGMYRRGIGLGRRKADQAYRKRKLHVSLPPLLPTSAARRIQTRPRDFIYRISNTQLPSSPLLPFRLLCACCAYRARVSRASVSRSERKGG